MATVVYTDYISKIPSGYHHAKFVHSTFIQEDNPLAIGNVFVWTFLEQHLFCMCSHRARGDTPSDKNLGDCLWALRSEMVKHNITHVALSAEHCSMGGGRPDWTLVCAMLRITFADYPCYFLVYDWCQLEEVCLLDERKRRQRHFWDWQRARVKDGRTYLTDLKNLF